MTRPLHDGGKARLRTIIYAACLIGGACLVAWFIYARPAIYHISFEPHVEGTTTLPVFTVIHLPTPEPLKGAYMTACTASVKRLRDKTLAVFDGTELNALVIDLKDYTGTISYASTTVPVPRGGKGCRIEDLKEFIGELHDRGIYAIGRITVFQDPLYANAHPELAIRSKSNPDKTWRDTFNLAYIDPGAAPFWDYIVSIAKEGHSIGFDELNFDYIRFPSDGKLEDMNHSWSLGRSKADVLQSFFLYLREQLASTSVPLSADLFGLTTSATGDLGIGQVLERALPYFDYIAPMVYPSHYANGFNGYAKPAAHPYEVIKYAMDTGVAKVLAASSSPSKLRPWLQAFDLGAVYTPAMVRAQMQATYDAGLTSWMLWNAAGVYNKDSLLSEGAVPDALISAKPVATSTRAR